VAVVDTVSFSRPPLYPVCPTEHGMVLSDDEKTLYVTCGYTDQLGILDLTTHAARRIDVGPIHATTAYNYFPYAISKAGDGTLWISCNSSGEIRVFDPATGAMDDSRKVRVGGVPLFGDFLSDKKTLILPHQGDDQVSIIDTSRSVELMVIPLPADSCLNAHAAMVMPGDHTAYVICEGDHVKRPGSLVALDLDAHGVAGYVDLGLYPDGIVSLPAAQ
jgi:hypothetical protein